MLTLFSRSLFPFESQNSRQKFVVVLSASNLSDVLVVDPPPLRGEDSSPMTPPPLRGDPEVAVAEPDVAPPTTRMGFWQLVEVLTTSGIPPPSLSEECFSEDFVSFISEW